MIFLKAAAFGAHQKLAHRFGIFRGVFQVRHAIAVQILIAVLISRDSDQHGPQTDFRAARRSDSVLVAPTFTLIPRSWVCAALPLERQSPSIAKSSVAIITRCEIDAFRHIASPSCKCLNHFIPNRRCSASTPALHRLPTLRNHSISRSYFRGRHRCDWLLAPRISYEKSCSRSRCCRRGNHKQCILCIPESPVLHYVGLNADGCIGALDLHQD